MKPKTEEDTTGLLEYKLSIDFTKLGTTLQRHFKSLKESNEDISALRIAVQGLREDKTFMQNLINECQTAISKTDVFLL